MQRYAKEIQCFLGELLRFIGRNPVKTYHDSIRSDRCYVQCSIQ